MSLVGSNNQSFTLSKKVNQIGRNPTINDIIINNTSVSKEHAIIEFDNQNNAFIIDKRSINGTFVNGSRITPNKRILLNNNDIIKFGKDIVLYTFSYNRFFNNNKINNINNSILKQTDDLLLSKFSDDPYKESYDKLLAKHRALLQYASDIQKKNDYLEYIIRNLKNKIENLEKDDKNQIINEKESIINILQSENDFYNKEMEKLKNYFSNFTNPNNVDILLNDYITEISNLRKANEEYKNMFMKSDRKWNELLKTNEALKLQVDAINKKWSEDVSKYIELLNINDKKLNDALSQIPNCYDNFNINKEQAAKYLVSHVQSYLNEKENLLSLNAMLNQKNCELNTQIDNLKNEICSLTSSNCDFNLKNLIDKNDELNDALINLRNATSPDIKVNYENMLKKLLNELYKKDEIIKELQDKFIKSTHSSNLFFDEKQVVSSISQALKSKDDEIQILKNQLQMSNNSFNNMKNNFDKINNNDNNNYSSYNNCSIPFKDNEKNINKSINMKNIL